MHDARIIANEILARSDALGLPLTQLSLQKLVYFMHGFHIARTGKPLVEDEFEAWEHGPVQRVVYDAFRSNGDRPIEEPATSLNPVTRTMSVLPALADPNAHETLDAHLEDFLEIPPFVLVEMTHERGSPWWLTMQAAHNSANVGMRIKNDAIRAAFETLLTEKSGEKVSSATQQSLHAPGS